MSENMKPRACIGITCQGWLIAVTFSALTWCGIIYAVVRFVR